MTSPLPDPTPPRDAKTEQALLDAFAASVRALPLEVLEELARLLDEDRRRGRGQS